MFKTRQIIVMAALWLIFTHEAQSQNRPPLPKNHTITGKVISATTGEALPGAVIKITTTNQTVLSNDQGVFTINLVNGAYNLSIHYLSHKTSNISIQVPVKEPLLIALETDDKNLQEVEIVSTGYQRISKEKTIGSFLKIDEKMINRSVSTNILDRIKDLAPGIYFTPKDAQSNTVARLPNEKNIGITIRGESTFSGATEPLIIIDNFPYEGDIKNINPGDVENITILKDASSASIWGARSGNGVIVITTKKGLANQKMKVEFNSNVTTISKPDLRYSTNFLDARSYIGVEQYLFDKGFFDAQINNTTSFPGVTPAVELMVKYKAATTDLQKTELRTQLDALKEADVRNDFKDKVYQVGTNQQCWLGIRGGANNMAYTLSAGYDQNKNNLIRNGYNRTSINSLTTYHPLKNLELTAGLNYSQNKTMVNNQFPYGGYTLTGNPYGYLYPYASLADANGNAAPVLQGLRASYLSSTTSKGFMDWNYRPLDEIMLADNTNRTTDLLITFGLKYQILPQLNAQINYQREKQIITGRNYRNMNTYYARNLINQFSVYDVSSGAISYIFPKGGILDLQNTDWGQNNLRGQLNYGQTFGKHAVTAIAGAEVRELTIEGYNRTSYGYNEQFGTGVSNLNYGTTYPVHPSGSAFIPGPGSTVFGSLTRNISYYAVGNYDYDGRYTLNLSARKDGANLFGAQANDKVKPFWSAGLGWNLSKEAFYNLKWLPYLRLRTTYGYQGNTNQNSSAYLSGSYNTSSDTGAPMILLSNAPNPRLQWENIRSINYAVDFAIQGNRINGSIDIYQKNGQDLIQPTALAPQTGFSTYQANTASTETRGLDMTLKSLNVNGSFRWETTLLLSRIKDKIIKYDQVRSSGSILSKGNAVGKPLDAVFSYRWAGLNPANGNPRGYINGKITEDYLAIRNNFNTDSLIYNGSGMPTLYGAIRNDFTFRRISISVNISYRMGYVFRRSSTSLNYTNVINLNPHTDYNKRWQKAGDEALTDVPSLVYPANANRNTFYQLSEKLVESGDHIRLQDIRIAYDLPASILNKLKMVNLNFYCYANNLGIIWRKNKLGIDPSAIGTGQGDYPTPFSLSFGLSASF